MMFGSVLEHLANLRHEKWCKAFVRSWMHYFGVPNFQKKFYHERIHYNLLDQKNVWECFRFFAKLCHKKSYFRDWKHCFGVSNFWQKFSHEHLQCNLLDPKWCLGVFRSISQRFIMKNLAKLVFRGWMHYFCLPNSRKIFATDTSNLTC